ncbi:MAG TPA: MAPEG family protein [Acetobacteraceae bacterium]|nr:MAPEG family protein [Acetobacteraceae bacterium]
MTIPQWVLLGFAGWTLVVLFGTIGVYRWSRILTGRARISEWRADAPQGSELYRRAMRAHLNCVENLPVYGAIVFCASVAGARGAFLDALAIAFLAARICQTIVHVAFVQSDFVASVRFALFFVQAVCMVAMGISVAASAAAGS